MLKPGLWTMDDGRLTVDYGPFHGHAINLFVTSRIKHTPYETFLAVYFLFLHLCHAINHFVASSSRNLDFDWPRSLFYLSTVHVSNSRDSNFPAVSLRSCETKKDLFQRSILNCCCVTELVTSSRASYEIYFTRRPFLAGAVVSRNTFNVS